MGQYNSMSSLFKEFGFPVLEELLKKKAQKEEDQEEVVEIIEEKKDIIIEVKDETPKV
jgi:hypothetical protein